ncbi:MAG: Wzz/FepE/Etk N-terminal domain-containing protein, partial [Gemmatimonadota bacterium]|nr:Wzz/FepE/Etk N-terminal domain-containing protein [Gemmatimonadota bacterium]
MVLRNRWLVLGIAAAVIGAVALFTVLQTPIYEGEATVLIDEERPGLDLLNGMIPAGLGAVAGLGGANQIQTDMRILRSRQVAEAVVDSLALRVALAEPNTPRHDVLQVLSASRGTEKGVYRLRLQKDQSYRVEATEESTLSPVPMRVEIGRPFRIGDFTLALVPSLRSDPPARIRFEVKPFRLAVQDVQKNLRVTRGASGAQILEIQFQHPDPVFSAAVPNVVTESFVRYKNRVSKAQSNSTIDFLQEQLTAYGRDLRDAEGRLQTFREQAQIVEPKTQATEQVRRLAEMQANRDALQTERESLRRLMAEVESEPAESTRSPYRQLATIPAFISNGSVQDILRSLIQLENERAELLVKRTAQSVDVQGIDRRVDELELQLYQFARNYLDGLDNRILALDAVLGRFNDQLELVPSREVELLRLTREQKLLEEVYTLLQTKLKEAQIQEAAEPANVQVIDSALVPETPSSPKPLLYLALAGVMGLGMGGVAALLREFLNPKVHSRQDVMDATSGLPVLGTIPRVQLQSLRNSNGRPKDGLRRLGARTFVDGSLVTREDPWNPASEAYRALRTNLTLSGTERPPQVLVVTSAVAEDGKSLSSANLAITLAQQGTHTLLIDADLRKGTLHRLFGVQQEPGLPEVVLGRAALDEVVQKVSVGEAGVPLHLVGSGRLPSNPADVLDSPQMRKFLKAVR